MAQNIYDKDGRKVGTIKSEQEAREDDMMAFSDNIGCFLILIIGAVGLLVIGAWIAGLVLIFTEGELGFLLVMIPILVATIIAGRKTISEKISTPWRAFWKISLIDTCAGMLGGMIFTANDMGYWDFAEAMVGGAVGALWFSILPAFIVAWVVRRNRKKRR